MSNNKKIIGKEVGTVSVHMYEENETGLPFFYIQAENKHVVPLSRAIENSLNDY